MTTIPLIAIVNESPTGLVLLRDMFEQSGFRTVLFNRRGVDNETLLDFIAAHSPELVIHDIPWPYEERIEEYASLREDTRSSVTSWIVVTTGAEAVQPLLTTNDPIVPKPFDFDALFLAVTRALRTPTIEAN